MTRTTYRFSLISFLIACWALACVRVAGQSSTSPLNLTWDNGVTDSGVASVIQPSVAVGSYYYRINTRSVEAWRSRLVVTSGEANLYLFRGAVPVIGQAGVKTSTLIGSDGFILSKTDFAPGQDWYLLVEATGVNNRWSLVTGQAYVKDLGSLPFTDTNNNGTYNIGEPSQNGGLNDLTFPPEGVLFFKVTLPPNVPAWSLWLNGGSQTIGVRKSSVPILFGSNLVTDTKQAGSLLLVPPYLGLGSDSYFVSVAGVSGTQVSLDSRIQQIETMAYNSSVPPFTVANAPYRVFRVDVPSGQIAWDVTLNRLSGDPSVFVKKETVASETENDAGTDAAGAVNDSLTLVAPDLTNGTWFVTVSGTAAYETGIGNGIPVFTDLNYRSVVVNDQPARTGWRYYRVPDFSAQVGTLGWQLNLTGAPVGTEVAIRRTQAPGIWKKRSAGSNSFTPVRYVDGASTSGILQRVDHEADIWYVGVYQPTSALGNFTLTLNDISAKPVALNGSSTSEVNQIEGEWRYFRLTVPSDTNLLGWSLHLADITGTAAPKISVRRDRLPPTTNLVNAGSTAWPSGFGWSQDLDFTAQPNNAGGVSVNGQRFLAARGVGRPLEAGTYYVGVLVGATSATPGAVKSASYTLVSRGIGVGYDMAPIDVPLIGGQVTTGNIAARDFNFYRVTIPTGSEIASWRLKLQPSVGEMFMQVRRGSIPDFSTTPNIGTATGNAGVLGGKRLKRIGAEEVTIMPETGENFIQPGTFYVAVVSEGLAPTPTVMGSGNANGVLESVSPVSQIELGTLSASVAKVEPFDLPWGGLAVYRFSVPSGMKVLEAFLTEREGNPGLSMIQGQRLPVPFPGFNLGDAGYGWYGGQTVATHPVWVSAHEPTTGNYTLIVRANVNGTAFERGKGKLNIRLVSALPLLGVGSGTRTATVVDQVAESWKYFQLDVPNNLNLKAIRVSLKNVTSGTPRMVIRKGTLVPKDFVTTSGLSSNSSDWLVNQQWAQTNDFSNIPNDSTGKLAAGRFFLAAYNSPMTVGSYIIGITKDSSIDSFNLPNTPKMSYTVVVEGVGDGFELPIAPLLFDNRTAPVLIDELPEREIKFYKVTVPVGKTSWRLNLNGSFTGDVEPEVRDGGLAVRLGKVPAFDTGNDPASAGGAVARLVGLDDHWTLLPKTTDGLLVSGEYFIAVTSFGSDPSTSQTGTNTSDLTLISKGELPVTNFPPLTVENEANLNYNLGPAELASYEFTVPERSASVEPYGLRLSIRRTDGFSNYSLRILPSNGLGFPTPPGTGADGYVGGLPSEGNTIDAITGLIYAQITPGTYRVVVRSSQGGGGYGDAAGTLSAQLLVTTGIPTIKFDGENLTAVNVGATTDILQYRLEVPENPNWLAWGILLEGAISGRPALYIRRGLQVDGLATPSVNSELIDWPIGHQWTQLEDFTKLRNDPQNTPNPLDRDRSQQFFMAARDKPLQPGTYFIGIDNRATTVIIPRTFTIRTFAVGVDYSIKAQDLSAVSAVLPIEIETPRMPRVFKITVPPLTRGWSVSLTPTLGDMTLRVRYGSVPDPVNDTTYPDLKGGVHIQKSGNERFTLLPRAGNTYLEEGDYYVMAVSEGQNPSQSGSLIGTGNVSGFIKNEGPITLNALGLVSELGLSQPVALDAGEIKVFSVLVPAGINNLQFKLNNRVGEVTMAIVRGSQIPTPGLTESYGVFGGETSGPPMKDRSVINLGNPAAGTYTIAVRAAGILPSSFAPGSATLDVNIIKPVPLNFAPELNPAGGSNVDARSLTDKEKYFYQLPIPRQVAGVDVLGWLITLDQGTPIVRIYNSALDFGKTAPVTMVGRSALIVAPFLTFNTNWYIEVEGVGASDYILRSESVKLNAVPWTLATSFNLLAGDTSPGAAEGIGIRRDLAQDAWNFFAVDVPTENLGLLRLALEQYGGNTNVYVRNGGIPTTDHSSSGLTGSRMFQYKMIAETSEAGNFSELSDGARKAERLVAGRWYIGVKSDPLAAVRTASGYRLKAHSGVVTDLNLTTSAPLLGQNLAERDWRYYRFTVPRTGIPAEWKPFFNRTSGSAFAYIRDSLPPFSYVPAASSSANNPSFVDWSIDAKNLVPVASYSRRIDPGVIVLPTPPLRPGSTYYLGLYGDNAGGSVDVSSTVSTSRVVIDREMVYNSGVETIVVPAGERKLIRVTTSADAARLKIECGQSALGLSLKLEQGAPPFTATVIAAHAQNSAPYLLNHLFNFPLGQNWPFIANRDYYLLLTNTTSSAITSTVTMRGTGLLFEDEDNDGLGDAWERLYFDGLTQTAAGDFDGDGSTNLQEYLNQTSPKDAASVLYLLTLRAPGGAASANPLLTAYPSGTMVGFTASAAPGDTFRQWRSSLPEIDRTLTATVNVPITANVQMTAEFQTSLNRGLDISNGRTWVETGNAWYGQYQASHDGIDSVTSPALGPGQQSRIASTFVGPGVLSFWWKVSSLANSGVFSLLVNNLQQANPISGTAGDWVQYSVTLPAGSHQVAWRYARTNTGTIDGENRGYLDQLTFSGDIVTRPDYASWLRNEFTVIEQGDVSISGNNSDPDRDLIPNLLEAAMGTAPKIYNGAFSPLSMVSTTQVGGNRINILASKRAERPLSDVSLSIHASPSLTNGSWVKIAEKIGDTNWILTGATMPSPEGPTVGQAVSYTIQEAVALPLGGRRFYRLVGKLEVALPSP